MNDSKLYSIILGPHTTEKSVSVADKLRKITFRVQRDATKTDIKIAVEKLFNVVVESVRTSTVIGKQKQFKQRAGQRSSWKKAVVSLAEGNDINLAEFE